MNRVVQVVRAERSLAELKSVIRSAADREDAAQKTKWESRREIGQALLEARQKIEGHCWIRWLEEEAGFGQRKAHQYMTIARNWDKISGISASDTDMPLKEVLVRIREMEEPVGVKLAEPPADLKQDEPADDDAAGDADDDASGEDTVSSKRAEERLERLEEAAKTPNPDLPAWEVRQGDCLDLLPAIATGSARLVFADPPYNIGIDYGGGEKEDLLPDPDYLGWASQWIAEVVRVLADDGSFWLLINDEHACEYGCMLKHAGLTIRNMVKWYETFGVNCTSKYNRTSRILFWAVKDNRSFVFNRAEVSVPSARQLVYDDPRANPDGKVLDDVWTDIPRLAGTHAERIPTFPTQLPVALLRRIVRAHSNLGDLVMDPFNGSGTTGAAALAAGRRYIGIEKQPRFAEMARNRLCVVQREFV